MRYLVGELYQLLLAALVIAEAVLIAMKDVVVLLRKIHQVASDDMIQKFAYNAGEANGSVVSSQVALAFLGQILAFFQSPGSTALSNDI